MRQVKRIVLLAVVLVATVGCDQVTKSVAQSRLSTAPPVVLLNGIVQFQYAENPARS